MGIFRPVLIFRSRLRISGKYIKNVLQLLKNLAYVLCKTVLRNISVNHNGDESP